jgi:hypothetical protein
LPGVPTIQDSHRNLAENAEDWLEYLDAFDEQGGSPDMVRHVLIRSFKGGDTASLAWKMPATLPPGAANCGSITVAASTDAMHLLMNTSTGAHIY